MVDEWDEILKEMNLSAMIVNFLDRDGRPTETYLNEIVNAIRKLRKVVRDRVIEEIEKGKLNNGEVAESGLRQSLAKRSGLRASLVQIQPSSPNI